MLEIRFVPATPPAGPDSTSNNPLDIQFVFRPARIQLPTRAHLGQIETMPSTGVEAAASVALTTAQGTCYEIGVEGDFPALDGLFRFLESVEHPNIPFEAHSHEDQAATMRLCITNTRDSTDRIRIGNYDIDYIEVPPPGAEYVRSPNSTKFKVLDLPRSEMSGEKGLFTLARYALQATLQILRGA